jgi:hypothetical protein
MALVKIKEVYLYVGPAESNVECTQIKKLLADNNIPHTVLAYNDPSQHEGVFNALGTWGWGEGQEKRVFTEFPIVHWKELYDDYSSVLRCATSVNELNISSLILNKKLVEA